MGCGYDLQGLSIRGVCPECGLAVRGTILATVDPNAEALQPLPMPKVTALGLLAWSYGGLAAALLAWLPRAVDIAERVGRGVVGHVDTPRWIAHALLVAILVSGLGAITLIRPTKHTTWKGTLGALLGVAAYAPLCWAVWRIQREIDPGSPPPYLVGGPVPERLAMRSVMNVSLLVLLLGLRTNARLLVERCLALRTGRVDRQTILAMALVVVISAGGDGLWGWSVFAPPGMQDLLQDAGSVLVAVGSLLLTIGIASATQDSRRIARAVLSPAPGLRQVLRGTS